MYLMMPSSTLDGFIAARSLLQLHADLVLIFFVSLVALVGIYFCNGAAQTSENTGEKIGCRETARCFREQTTEEGCSCCHN
jgi:hypothetical protein